PPGPPDTALDRAAVGPAALRRRDRARRRPWLARHHVHGEPGRARAAVVLVRGVGPDADCAGGDRHRPLSSYRFVLAADHPALRRTHAPDHLPDEPLDDGRALRPRDVTGLREAPA